MLVKTAGQDVAVPDRWPAAWAGEELLESKTSPPELPAWIVRRERVDRLISRGVRGPLTIVTGPPGAGKTVAMAAWAATRPAADRVAWVALDRFDDDPAVFWPQVLAALLRASAAVPQDLPGPPDGTPQGRMFLRRLARALADQSQPVVLVLDDVHLISEPAVLDSLGYVLWHAAGGLRLLVASRMDPLLPLHRYRLAGELTEIRQQDLAFSASEAGALAAQHGLDLSPSALAVLTRRSEGWAAGLRLAALSMAGRPDPERFVREFGADVGAVTSYLVDEVLDAQPAQVRDVLLKTSILDRVSDELACELCGDASAAGVIPALARANVFVQPLGQGWYRYHALFADVLRLKLRYESPQEVGKLRRRAARWLRRNATVAEAADQAAAAGDWQLAARAAVEEVAVTELVDPQAGQSLAAAFRRLPSDLAPEEPAGWIVSAALALRDRREAAALACLRTAERSLASVAGGEGAAARLAAGLVRLALARRRGDLDQASAAADEADAALGEMPGDVLARHPQVRAEVLGDRGIVRLWQGRLADASAAFAEAAAAGGPRESTRWTGWRALAEAARGGLRQAAGLAAQAVTDGGRRAGPGGTGRTAELPASAVPALAGMEVGRRGDAGWTAQPAAEVALAWVSVEQGRLSDSAARLARVESALAAAPDQLVGSVAALVGSRQRLAGQHPAAAAELARAARQGWSPPRWLEEMLMLVESQALLATGDVAAAMAVGGGNSPDRSLAAAVALARAQLAAGDLAAAGRTLGAGPGPHDAQPGQIRLEADLAQAQFWYGAEDPLRGRVALDRALRHAVREQFRLTVALQRGWIHPVVRGDPALADSYRRIFGPAPVAASLGRRREQAGPPASAGARAAPAPVAAAPAAVVERLSAKEREVLQLASQMLNTAEIAGEMYVSVNTVKSHLKSIFRKLGASHRGEAVRRARQLGLL